jgi:hypothetical protein
MVILMPLYMTIVIIIVIIMLYMMIIIVIMIMQSWMVILMPLLFPAAVQVSLILQGTIQRQTHIILQGVPRASNIYR